jgi:hypothetical protein
LKKDYLAGVGDSCDLVVVGGYYGKGKRTNTYGAFLLACYDADAEQFQTACKIGTGFSDQMLVELYNLLSPLELASGKRSDVQADMSKPPDVWFEPKVVFEVLTADLTLSPIYMAAQGLVRPYSVHCVTHALTYALICAGRRERYFFAFPEIHQDQRRQGRRRRYHIGTGEFQPVNITPRSEIDFYVVAFQIAEFYEAQALASKGNRGGGGNDEY